MKIFQTIRSFLMFGSIKVAAFTTTSTAPIATTISQSQLLAKKEATFGMGCFWEPSESFLKVDGVSATRAGYCGAGPTAKTPPTYNTVCYGREWVEAVRVVYDDSVISYDELLEKFFDLHKANPQSRQYDSIIFGDSDQMSKAQSWIDEGIKERKRRKDGYPVSLVKLEPISSFWRAEEYHQDYWEKQRFRFGFAALLLAGASGFYDTFLPSTLTLFEHILSVRSIFNFVVEVGCVGVIIERLFSGDVQELKPGDLTKSTS